MWRVDFKYPGELTQTFMSSNLIGGFFNRLEASRKYLFGSMGVLGETNNSLISGALIARGQDIKPVVDVAPDFESYDYKRLDLGNAEDKAFFEAALAWDLEIDGKKWVDGKNVSIVRSSSAECVLIVPNHSSSKRTWFLGVHRCIICSPACVVSTADLLCCCSITKCKKNCKGYRCTPSLSVVLKTLHGSHVQSRDRPRCVSTRKSRRRRGICAFPRNTIRLMFRVLMTTRSSTVLT